MTTRFLLVGSSATVSLERCYLRALNSLDGISATLFDPDIFFDSLRLQGLATRLTGTRYTSAIRSHRAGSQLLRFLRTARERIDAVVVFKGMQFSPALLRRCKAIQPSATWININPDDPFNVASASSSNSKVLESVSLYDIYCIWSHQLAERLAAAGCRQVVYLPFGYDPHLHFPPPGKSALGDGAVSFVGSWDPDRERLLNTLVDYDLRIYGGAWSKVHRHSPLRARIKGGAILGEELSRVVAESSVSLNILRPQNEGSHNMRTFEIPAIGGLMLTTRSREQNQLFPEGEGSLMFSNTTELREQIDSVLMNPSAARAIRSRGHELINGHSYTERARQLISVILNSRSSR